MNPPPAPRTRKPWTIKAAISFIIFILICTCVIGGLIWIFAYPYINGKEEWQDERTCTIDTAYKRTSSGGFRMGGSSTTIMVETPDCGKIFLFGTLDGKTTQETIQYLDTHQGEQFRFYFGKIQIDMGSLDAKRVEEIN